MRGNANYLNQYYVERAVWCVFPHYWLIYHLCSHSVVPCSAVLPSLAHLQTVRLYGLLRPADVKPADIHGSLEVTS